jgi:hypothetical protein
MKTFFALTLIAALLLGAPGPGSAAEAAPDVTVVELFTSQGCSSCPPADAFLGELAKRPDVIALGFHVDYWDYIGWQDRFASPGGTDRQRRYAGGLGSRYVYTPQMVVDGVAHATGSRVDDVERLIAARRSAPKVPVRLTRADARTLNVSIGSADYKGAADVWFVTFLRQETTDVARGENRGRRLTNFNIVRTLKRIGGWNGTAANYTVPLDDMEGDACAVLLQAAGPGAILGAATETLAP